MVASKTALLLFSSNVKIKQVFKDRDPASYLHYMFEKVKSNGFAA